MVGDEETFIGRAAQQIPIMQHCMTLSKGASSLAMFQTIYETVYATVGASGIAALGFVAWKAYSFYKSYSGSAGDPRV